jgi:hypothetical protein
MVSGLGPVVRYELITTARRGRYYLARVVYGSGLLFLLWSHSGRFEAIHPGGATPEEVRSFAESTFIQFAGAQGLALLCLIPALVAGVIADEHQRKTLHYLLASQLSSAEIVLGKLAARMAHIGTYVALGVPVVCLLALYGGLNPENVFYVYLGTSTTWLVGRVTRSWLPTVSSLCGCSCRCGSSHSAVTLTEDRSGGSRRSTKRLC